MTAQSTSQETCSDRTALSDITDLPVECRSGSQETDQFPERIDELTRSEQQGANDALRRLASLVEEVEEAYKNANFERQKGILRGMLKVYECAHRGILIRYPELNKGN